MWPACASYKNQVVCVLNVHTILEMKFVLYTVHKPSCMCKNWSTLNSVMFFLTSHSVLFSISFFLNVDRFDRMPGLVKGSIVEDHDQAITEALEQFCNSPEQTYEQFLSTFTYLTPGEHTERHIFFSLICPRSFDCGLYCRIPLQRMWGSHDWLLLEDMETRSRERWTAAESDKERMKW